MSRVRTATSKSYTSASTVSADELPHVPCKLLSWNIDGLNESNLSQRTRRALDVMLASSPQVIVLQEVVQEIVPLIVQKLSAANFTNCERAVPGAPYFTLCFYSSDVTCVSSCRSQFPVEARSLMYRDVLQCTFSFQSIPFTVLTSHLESCKESSIIRTAQLVHCFTTLLSLPHSACLVGDLNMRDTEATAATAAVHSTSHVLRDAWIECGKPAHAKHTWICPGAAHVKCRFDRLYHNSKDVSIANVALLGSVDISDHMALVSILRLTGSPSSVPAATTPATSSIMSKEDMRAARLRALDAASSGQSCSSVSVASSLPAKRRSDGEAEALEIVKSGRRRIVCPDGMDEDVFYALPENMQIEVLNENMG